MTTMDRGGRDAPCLAQLDAPQREQAMARFAVLRPHLEDGVPLARAAGDAGVAVRTAQRWLARYRACGLAGLARRSRADTGRRRLPAELAELIEGLAPRKPRPTVAAIHRRALAAAQQRGWPAPSYGTVYAIARTLDPAMVTLAQEGQPAFRDRFELAWRHRAQPAQRPLAGRPHRARRPGPRSQRHGRAAVADHRHRRPLPRDRRIHCIPRRSVRAAHLAGAPPGGLA